MKKYLRSDLTRPKKFTITTSEIVVKPANYREMMAHRKVMARKTKIMVIKGISTSPYSSSAVERIASAGTSKSGARTRYALKRGNVKTIHPRDLHKNDNSSFDSKNLG